MENKIVNKTMTDEEKAQKALLKAQRKAEFVSFFLLCFLNIASWQFH